MSGLTLAQTHLLTTPAFDGLVRMRCYPSRKLGLCASHALFGGDVNECQRPFLAMIGLRGHAHNKQKFHHFGHPHSTQQPGTNTARCALIKHESTVIAVILRQSCVSKPRMMQK